MTVEHQRFQVTSEGHLTCPACGAKIPVNDANAPEFIRCPNKKTDDDAHLLMRKIMDPQIKVNKDSQDYKVGFYHGFKAGVAQSQKEKK